MAVVLARVEHSTGPRSVRWKHHRETRILSTEALSFVHTYPSFQSPCGAGLDDMLFRERSKSSRRSNQVRTQPRVTSQPDRTIYDTANTLTLLPQPSKMFAWQVHLVGGEGRHRKERCAAPTRRELPAGLRAGGRGGTPGTVPKNPGDLTTVSAQRPRWRRWRRRWRRRRRRRRQKRSRG